MLGAVVMVVSSNLARGKIFTASIGSVDSLYGSIKKLFHYAIFQNVFHILIIHLWSMFYNTYY